MTIEEFYHWAKIEGKENYTIKICDNEGTAYTMEEIGFEVAEEEQTIYF